MRVLIQIDITETMLTSPTVAEPSPGEAAYNAATTYATGAKVIVGAPTSTVTITNADPAVVSWATHGLPDGTPVYLTTTGVLPAGLSVGTRYYIVNGATGTFQLAETMNGPALPTTSAGSGTHTAKAAIHRTYVSLQDSNTGHYPPSVASGDWWQDDSASNLWALLDLLDNKGTSGASPMTYVITPGQRIDSVALDGLVADEVTITVKVASVVIYTETSNLSTRQVSTWYQHLITPFTYRSKVSRFNLPPVVGAEITITATRATGPVTIGALGLGRSVWLGDTVIEPDDDELNFSRFEREFDGRARLTPRRSAPKITMQAIMDDVVLPISRVARTALGSRPAFFFGLDDDTHPYADAVNILAIPRSWKHTPAKPTPDKVTISLDLEGP